MKQIKIFSGKPLETTSLEEKVNKWLKDLNIERAEILLSTCITQNAGTETTIVVVYDG